MLFIAGCPNYESAARSVKDALSTFGVEDEVVLTRISTSEEAERERFLGSPTVRIDGRDVESEAAGRVDFGLKCRLYRSANAFQGLPPADWTAAAIRDAKSNKWATSSRSSARRPLHS